MTEYRPTEYVVDFGDYRSNQFVRLNMALIEQNSAKLGERIVRCRDCHWAKPDQSDHDYRGEYRCNMWIADVSADGYCWRGMRKEGGE